jgi:hypothetical protein
MEVFFYKNSDKNKEKPLFYSTIVSLYPRHRPLKEQQARQFLQELSGLPP